MNRRLFNRAGLVAAFAPVIPVAARAESDKTHRVAIQVSSGDHDVQRLALGNAHNYATYYRAKGEPYAIEVVAFGPGYAMMRDDVSGVKATIESLQKELGPTIIFAACQNSRRGIAESLGRTPDQIPQIEGVVDAPSGIVRLAELQAQGWSYVRP